MKKYKVGYTTGVFDMFHAGHLHIIKKAKEQCEHLIVGVSTDELVMKSKNHLPVIPFEDRVEIIKALRYVDEVVPQVDKDKMGAYHKYKFDAMFVGDDWLGSAIFTKCERELKQYGTDVIYIPRIKGLSSTVIKERLEEITRLKGEGRLIEIEKGKEF